MEREKQERQHPFDKGEAELFSSSSGTTRPLSINPRSPRKARPSDVDRNEGMLSSPSPSQGQGHIMGQMPESPTPTPRSRRVADEAADLPPVKLGTPFMVDSESLR